CASSGGASAPQRTASVSEDAPDPDCRNPAGCVFCIHYRGIDSFDYAWSLVSFKVLKGLELSKYKIVADVHNNRPQMVVQRVADILAEFACRGETHAQWVLEAKTRCSEEDFHPRWSGFILLAEAIG
ncbi:hypothetical protein LY625_12880, partial [Lysobacter sp. GX 14042]|uniref:hypothetical protein n=1 Tax=Lysobacter sp. GX 14042 TaxID=2907155 RepID=UPI001F39C085